MLYSPYTVTVCRGEQQTEFGPFDQLSAHILLTEILASLGVKRDKATHYAFNWRTTPHGITLVKIEPLCIEEEDLDTAQVRFRLIFPKKAP